MIKYDGFTELPDFITQLTGITSENIESEGVPTEIALKTFLDYIKIKGRWHYLYRAIDADGLTLDIWLRKKRDTQAAYAFLKRLHKQFGQPRVIVTDKAPSIGSAFRKLQSNGLYTKTEHRTVKYLNNLIEQDHRPIKRRNKFYRSLGNVTIK